MKGIYNLDIENMVQRGQKRRGGLDDRSKY
jgi:hypothetical protein